MTQDNSTDSIRDFFEAAQRREAEARSRQALNMLRNVCRDAVVSLEEADIEEACDRLRDFVQDEAALAPKPGDSDLVQRGRLAAVAMSQCCRKAIAAAEAGDEDGAIALLQAFADSDNPGEGMASGTPAAKAVPGRNGP